MGLISGTVSRARFAFNYATKPYFRYEAKRNWRRSYREWKTFDRTRHMEKTAAAIILSTAVYLIFTSRWLRILFRIPSEDPNFISQTKAFREEQNALWKRREEAEKRLMDSNTIAERNNTSSARLAMGDESNPFGDGVNRSRFGGTPLYSSGDGEVPSPANVTGIKNGQR